MQYTVLDAGHAQVLAFYNKQGELKDSLRICSETQIQNMSDGSLRLYRREIKNWRKAIHDHGTPEAIRTVDFLSAAVDRAQRSRAQDNNPPAC